MRRTPTTTTSLSVSWQSERDTVPDVLRRSGKPVLFAVNKVDDADRDRKDQRLDQCGTGARCSFQDARGLVRTVHGAELEGVLTALLTPCRADGRVDKEALAELVDFQAGSEVRGLFILGTAGQGPMLSSEERRDVARVVIDTARELKVVVHVGSIPTETAEALASDAVEAGATAISAVPPVYYRPDFLAVRRYYERLAHVANGVPLLAYNNPAATGYDLRPDEAAELYGSGVIAGVKQASSSIEDLHALLSLGVPTWAANATLNTAALTMGARGSISTITNVLPELFVRLYDAIDEGDLPLVRNLQHRIDRGARKLRHPVIGALHAGSSLRGLPALQPRHPLRLPDEGEMDLVREALGELND